MKLNIFLGSITLLAAKLTFFPDLKILVWLFIAVVVDLLTGMVKAWATKTPITSKGFRETAVKALQYVGLIVGGIIIGNTFEKQTQMILWINDGMIVFLLYVEVYSIFENLRDMNPTSKVSLMVFNPALTILTLGMQRLSLSKTPEEKKEIAKDFSSGTTLIAIGFAFILFNSCKIVQYKDANAPVTITNKINYDSLLIVWKDILLTPESNSDSLFKNVVRTIQNDTVTIVDNKGRITVTYWFNGLGKPEVRVTSSNPFLSLMMTELTKLILANREIKK